MFGREIVQVWEYERGLMYKKGKFEQLIEPGRYVLWPWQHRHIVRVDTRETSQSVQGQEVLTKDKVGVRVTLVAQYQVSDPVAAMHNVENFVDQLYQDLQLTLRESITSHTTEELLADREALSTHLLQDVAPRAEKYGVELNRVGVKDIVLPDVSILNEPDLVIAKVSVRPVEVVEEVKPAAAAEGAEAAGAPEAEAEGEAKGETKTEAKTGAAKAEAKAEKEKK